jgi:hypothetical protein
VVAGILALVGLLGAALITGWFANRDTRPVPVEQLITVLNGRADRILREMDAEDAKAIAALRAGKRRADAPAFLARSRATRVLFLDLQKQHVAALRRGDFLAAHEILSELQAVLAHRASVISDAHATGWYMINPRFFQEYSRQYPGGMRQRDSVALSKIDSLAWSTERLASDWVRAHRVWLKVDSSAGH